MKAMLKQILYLSLAFELTVAGFVEELWLGLQVMKELGC